MKKSYPNSNLATILEGCSVTIWFFLLVWSMWAEANNGKIFVTSFLWLSFSIMIFYIPEED